MEDVYDPLDQYQSVYKKQFRKNAETAFQELAKTAQVDVAANKALCDEIRKDEQKRDEITKTRKKWIALCVCLWIVVAALLIIGILQVDSYAGVGMLSAAALLVLLLLVKVHPKLKLLNQIKAELNQQISQKKQIAWEQMKPLNRLYDWDVLTRLITQTVPKIEFDPFMTTQRLADLRKSYGFVDDMGDDSSVLCSHSGLINGNPFIFCRFRNMTMGTKEYSGSLTIQWTTLERDSDGKLQTRYHTETLYATHTAPYPYYNDQSMLIYGNNAAPNLTFYRTQNDLAGKEDTFKYKRTLKRQKKESNNMNSNFVMMENEDFEVAFDTRNRNDEQQYRLLFTPLAQQSMLKILRDETEGYGDDFDFKKDHMINTIIADHLNGMQMDLNPSVYYSYDFEEAEKRFVEINAEYFRAIYFAFAPLLSIPLYQQMRPVEDIYGRDMEKHSAMWEHEALANFWGDEHFKSPDCATLCILKTQEKNQNDQKKSIQVSAHGFSEHPRTTYYSVYGGDGHYHDVPVHWFEYFPTVGHGQFVMQENLKEDNDKTTPLDRANMISNFVGDNHNSKVYRRHIFSSI